MAYVDPTAVESYGTNDAQAFAYFIAGLHAGRAQRVEAAADLYTSAIRLDSQYHKALNNLGLLWLQRGAEAFVEGTDDIRTRRLLEDAWGLFARARVIQTDVAEYPYNLATASSYLGRLELRLGDLAKARARQGESIAAYNEALTRLGGEVTDEHDDIRRRVRRWWRRHDEGRDDHRAERQAFQVSVHFALATSWALRRQIDDPNSAPTPEESAALAAAQTIASKSGVTSHPRMEYNLICYYVATKDPKDLELAVSLLRTLRAVYPQIPGIVASDPDLAGIPEIAALFSLGQALPPLPQPRPATRGPAKDDDPDRDEPT